MNMDYSIIERVGVTFAVFLSTYGAVQLFTVIQRHRLNNREMDLFPGFGSPTDGPRLLYFWTEECAPCRAQEREINQAKKSLEVAGVYLSVEKLNAHSEKLFTDRFNIMTVPTTVLLDPGGVVVGWNPGLTRASRIVDQVSKSLPGTAKEQAA
jgi:thiol-disulfide isomerase/thioredoxin